jgi:AcrR family transcriptional regulator
VRDHVDPGPVGSRAGRSDATRHRLEHSALRLFAEHGYDSVTTEQIAEAAGVTQRTLFRHFGSKLAVLFGDTDGRTSSFVLDLYRQPPTISTAEALRSAITMSMPSAVELEADLVRARVLRDTPSLAAELRRFEAEFEHGLARWLAQRRRAEVTPEVRAVAAAIVAVRRVVVDEWRAGGGGDFLGVALPLLTILTPMLDAFDASGRV